jgi:eukaryotic-like serine/threonine-protein kinase
MALPAGARRGPYEIVSLIGAGGMGEVYQARDTRLDRKVAVKVLAPELASDAEFRARFEREAKSISALNHPHICGLFDIGREQDTEYLVLELLEGETLAARLERGPLPLAQVLRFGIEIADALEAAHRKGIIHRDLKPGNIMLTAMGTKLLDFGLAKQTVGAPGQALSMLATAPGTGTAQGTIIGTLQYMAPEQVQGAPADARTDIFALGSILYEMATGRRAFEATTQASLIAKILETDVPAISTHTPLAPAALDHVVQSCLAKDPGERWQTAHDVLVELRWIQQQGAAPTATQTPRVRPREWAAWAAAGVGVVIAATSLLHPGSKPVVEPRSRTDILLPPRLSLHDYGDGPVISPDGLTVVMAGVTEGIRRLYARALDGPVVRPLPGTEGAMGPFWSPDGRTIGFSVGDQLRRVDLGGGAVVTFGEHPGGFLRRATMNRHGVVLFDSWNDDVIRRVGERGTTAVTRLDASHKERRHETPEFLPDGQHFLFFVGPPRSALYVGSLAEAKVQRVADVATEGRYTAGHLLYARQRTIMARPFDPQLQEFRGPEIPVADGVVAGLFSVSQNGTVAYRPAESDYTSLVWFDRRGSRLATLGEPAEYRQVVLSPSGGRVAVVRGDPESTDLWIAESDRGVFSRATRDPGVEADPVWSPDERSLAFTAWGAGVAERGGLIGRVVRKNLVSGAEEPVGSAAGMYLDDWTADGKFLICRGEDEAAVFAVPMPGPGPAVRLLAEDIDQTQVSVDGRWVAYNSAESGQWEVYIASFPGFSGKQQVSVAGGVQPHWRRDGRELFYMALDGRVMSVAIRTTPRLEIDTPNALFTTNLVPAPGWPEYAVSPDGQRFLVMESSRQFFTVLQHWLPARANVP